MKKNRTTANKKRVNKTQNRTVRKQRGGDLDETLKTNIEIVRGCNPQFYPPSDDKPRNINKSLQSLGIHTETLAITEKPELLKYYGNLLDEYIEDKREIFFDIIDKLVLDHKIPNNAFPKQNIEPTLCCMSLLEKMKAINRMATENFKAYFNPKNPYFNQTSKKTSKKSKTSKSDTLDLPETSYFIIDKPFLEKMKERQDLQEIRIVEEFLEHYDIDKPIANTETAEADTTYVDDLVRLFHTRGTYNRVDETVLGVLKSKIRSINEDKQTSEIEKEKEKKRQADEEKRQEEFERINKKRQEEQQKVEEERKKQEKRQTLYRIIEGFIETGGLFGDARATLQYFSEAEKKLIIKRLSPDIGNILQDQDTNLDDLLIEILQQNWKAREQYKKGLPKLDKVAKDKHGSSWNVAYSLLATMENGQKRIGRKMYQHSVNGQVRESMD